MLTPSFSFSDSNSGHLPTCLTNSDLEIAPPSLAICRTIFFWAPMAKWALVIAGLKDLQRPADKLSLNQNLALAATGFIWVRVYRDVP